MYVYLTCICSEKAYVRASSSMIVTAIKSELKLPLREGMVADSANTSVSSWMVSLIMGTWKSNEEALWDS